MWQVLGVYAASSWGVLQVVEFLIEGTGFPDWVSPAALILLLIGLPIVLATAFVQEGAPGRAEAVAPVTPAGPGEEGATGAREVVTAATAARPGRRALLTWRNATLGGAAAFALLALAIGGFFLMRNLGFGPLATLQAQGVLDERDEILLADFTNRTNDSTLATVVTEALRVDLDNSDFLSIISPARAGEVLARMGRAGDGMDEDAALEAATREGIPAVLAGEVSPLGGGFVLTGRVVRPGGDVLASFRTVARDDDELIDAIDELSADIRGKAGESLRSVARSDPLESVTTASLEALRLFSRALALFDQGAFLEPIPLLEEAVEIDPDFAMAHRKLAVLLANRGGDPARVRAAATRAYELRDRLTERERGLAEAYYYSEVEEDRDRTVRAYEQVLAIDSTEPTALNNLGLQYRLDGKFDEAEILLRRAAARRDASPSPLVNLITLTWNTRRDREAMAWLDSLVSRHPDSPLSMGFRGYLPHLQRRWSESREVGRDIAASYSGVPFLVQNGLGLAASASLGLGALGEAREDLRQATDHATRSGDPGSILGVATQWAYAELLAVENEAAALALLDEALEAVPDLDAAPGAALVAATLLALAGDSESGRGVVDAVEEGTPDDLRNSDFQRARRAFDYADAYAARRYEEAVREADALLETEVACAEARCAFVFFHARALDAAGRGDEAIEAYERVLDGPEMDWGWFDPIETGVALERLVLLHAENGDAVKAAEYMNRYEAMWGDADEELARRVRRTREAIRSLAVPADT